MTSDDLVRDAAAELYSSDPDQFIERRGVLVAQARAAGEASAAKRIAGLRKPTRSAWVVNQLVHAAPDVTGQLAELGTELRAAQRSLDGAAIRELSVQRRHLIEALARQAFAVSGQQAPSAALRDEVTATLSAALADPRVADQLTSGTLERAAHSEGFGPAGAPVLTLVSSSPGGRRSQTARAAGPVRPGSTGTGPTGTGPKAAGKNGTAAPAVRGKTTATALAAARAKAEREQHRQVIADAEQAAAEADHAADAADRAEQQQESAVRLIEEELADARRQLADARLQARRARTGQRQARLALSRIRKSRAPQAGSDKAEGGGRARGRGR